MSDHVEIAVGQWWSSPDGIIDAVQIVRRAEGLDFGMGRDAQGRCPAHDG